MTWEMPVRGVAAALLAALALLTSGGAGARAEVDFSGKSLNIYIGYGTGGTYDAYARLFAQHLRTHLAGQPSIVVQSMAGAGGVRMTNFAANAMPADGTQLLVPPDTVVISQLLRPDSVKYDARKFHYIGGSEQTNTVWVVRRDTGVTSVNDLKTREIASGHSGPGSTAFMTPALARELLGLKVKLIAGYEGSNKTMLAIEQKEVDASAFNWAAWITAVPHWFSRETPQALPILQVGLTPDPDLPQVPMLRDLAAPGDSSVVDFIATHGIVGRSLAAPPGTPADHVRAFRAAFARMLADAAYREDAAKRKLRIVATTGEALQAAVGRALDSADEKTVARARGILFER